MNDPNAPVIVAVAQQTWREPSPERTPVEALHEVASMALAELDLPRLRDTIDTLATVRFVMDSDPNLVPLLPRNPGRLVANRLGIREDAACYQTTIGGNTPQYLVNHFAGQLAAGSCRAVLISGVELLNSFFSALRGGGDISAWKDEEAGLPISLGEERPGVSASEQAHGMYEPINTYPLFETALRHHLGTPAAEHDRLMAELCSRMSAVAAEHPCAWQRQALTAEEIAAVTPRNRYVGYPYTRAMNALLSVDMAAALIMTTAGTARDLGIDPATWIYLRGGVDVNEVWHVSTRERLYAAPAIGLACGSALAQAGLSVGEMDAFDIYSCFPCAVEIACREIGIPALDPRGVTVTGGLPFFGGPGNNYSLHAIATMVESLRGRGRGHGLVTANGYYLTKHSVGVYSTEPGPGAWQPADSRPLQRQIDAAPRRQLAEDPAGPAVIDAYTVAFDRSGPQRGIVIAHNPAGERIVANTEEAPGVFERLVREDAVGAEGHVERRGDLNIFRL